VKDSFGAIPRWQESQIDMAVGNINGIAIFTAAGDFFEAE
jgi:hypothetical protein